MRTFLKMAVGCVVLAPLAFTHCATSQNRVQLSSADLVKAPSASPVLSPEAEGRAKQTRLPVTFEANEGQYDARTKFVARTNQGVAFVEPDALTLRLREQNGGSTVVRAKFLGSNPRANFTADGEADGVANHYAGSDSAHWVKGVKYTKRVKGADLYPGVDVMYYGGEEGALEYDFVVAPNADARKLQWVFEGADAVSLRGDALEVKVGDRTITHKAPLAYQEISGVRKPVAVSFALDAVTKIVTFNLGEYDRSQVLVIDPVIRWATFVGGTGNDGFQPQIGIDLAKNVYVVSASDSTDYPTTLGAFGPTDSKGREVVLSKLSPDATTLLYSTYIGGIGNLDNIGFVVAKDGTSYVGFNTFGVATEPPVTLGAAHATGTAYVAKIASDGTLAFGTKLVPSGAVSRQVGLALHPITNDVFVGIVFSAGAGEPATLGAWSTTAAASGQDISVTRLKSDGTSIVASTFVGGNGINALANGLNARFIAADAQGNVTVAVDTTSSNLPNTVQGAQPNNAGAADLYVAQLNPDLNAANWATYLGGSGEEHLHDFDIDEVGNAYVLGETQSPNYPTVNAVQPVRDVAGISHGFVARVNTGGATLGFSTYFYESTSAISTQSLRHGPNNRLWISGADYRFTGVGFSTACSGAKGGVIGIFSDSNLTVDGFYGIAPNGGSAAKFVLDENEWMYTVAGTDNGLVTEGVLQSSTKGLNDHWIAKLNPVRNTGTCLPCTGNALSGATNPCPQATPFCHMSGRLAGICSECGMAEVKEETAVLCPTNKPACLEATAQAEHAGNTCGPCTKNYNNGIGADGACPTMALPFCVKTGNEAGTCVGKEVGVDDGGVDGSLGGDAAGGTDGGDSGTFADADAGATLGDDAAADATIDAAKRDAGADATIDASEDDFGIIEGGGIECSSRPGTHRESVSAVAMVALAGALVRRRRSARR